MMENLVPVRLARVVGGAAVLAGLAASITSCSGNGSNAPSTTQSPTTTTTTTAVPDSGRALTRADRKEQPHMRKAVHADSAGASGHSRRQRKYRIGHRERAAIDGWLITTTGSTNDYREQRFSRTPR